MNQSSDGLCQASIPVKSSESNSVPFSEMLRQSPVSYDEASHNADANAETTGVHQKPAMWVHPAWVPHKEHESPPPIVPGISGIESFPTLKGKPVEKFDLLSGEASINFSITNQPSFTFCLKS